MSCRQRLGFSPVEVINRVVLRICRGFIQNDCEQVLNQYSYIVLYHSLYCENANEPERGVSHLHFELPVLNSFESDSEIENAAMIMITHIRTHQDKRFEVKSIVFYYVLNLVDEKQGQSLEFPQFQGILLDLKAPMRRRFSKHIQTPFGPRNYGFIEAYILLQSYQTFRRTKSFFDLQNNETREQILIVDHEKDISINRAVMVTRANF